jgi:hypothetical protein
MYDNLQAIQPIRGFVKHQIGNAPIINKTTNAPKVMATTEKWEFNIGPIVVGMIENMIHQFLWAYKDGFSFSLKDLGSLSAMKFKLNWPMIHLYSKGFIDTFTRNIFLFNQRPKSCWRLDS